MSPTCPNAQHRIEAVPMADESIASIIPLHQPKKAKTGAERARAYRQRKRHKAKAAASPNDESPSSELLIPEGFSSADSAFAEPPVTPPPTVTLHAATRDEDAPPRSVSPILLRAAALALAGVGIAMNGSLRGRSDQATPRDGCFSPLAWPLISLPSLSPPVRPGFGKPDTAPLRLRDGPYGR